MRHILNFYHKIVELCDNSFNNRFLLGGCQGAAKMWLVVLTGGLVLATGSLNGCQYFSNSSLFRVVARVLLGSRCCSGRRLLG